MALPIEDRKLVPTNTKPAERTKTPPSTPSKPAPSTPKKKSEPTIVEKALDGAGLKGAAAEAKKGIEETASAASKQKGGARAGAIVGGAIETAVKTAAVAGKEISDKVKDATKPLHEPFTREIKEAGKEIGKAGADYGKKWFDALNPTDGVGDIWKDKDLSTGAKVGATVGKVIENGVTESIAAGGALLNLGKEALEGVGEIWLHNPVNNAIKEAGKGAYELGKKGVELAGDGIEKGVELAGDAAEAVGGWFSDRINGGAEGAVKAGKTSAETGSKIAQRSKDQAEENAREVGGSATKFGTGFVDSLNPFDGVSDIWNGDDSVGVKVGGVVGKVVENGLTESWNNVTNAADLVGETFEAAGESVVTGLQNTGDAVVGGAKAVGDFVGGLFG